MDRVNQILQKSFKLATDKLADNLTMKDLPNWDSLSHMDLILELEGEFNIQFTGDEIAEMTSFDSIKNIVSKYIN